MYARVKDKVDADLITLLFSLRAKESARAKKVRFLANESRNFV